MSERERKGGRGGTELAVEREGKNESKRLGVGGKKAEGGTPATVMCIAHTVCLSVGAQP